MAKIRIFMVTYHDLSINGDVKTEVFRTFENAEKSPFENVEDFWCDFVKIHEIDFEKGKINHVKTIDSSDLEEVTSDKAYLCKSGVFRGEYISAYGCET